MIHGDLMIGSFACSPCLDAPAPLRIRGSPWNAGVSAGSLVPAQDSATLLPGAWWTRRV